MLIGTHIDFDSETLEVLSWKGYEYTGPLDLFGGDKTKARQLTTQQMQQQATNSAADRASAATAQSQSQADQNKVQATADQLTSTGPGKMDPWSAANYASNMTDIADTMAKQREMGFRAIGQSGFGSSPGAVASLMNTSSNNQGRAETGAFRNALQSTLSNNLTGTNLNMDLGQQYEGRAQNLGAQSGNESNMAVSDAAQRVKMGSTLGDVASGIGTVANIATNFIPGAQGFNAIRQIGQGVASAANRPSTSAYTVPGNGRSTGGFAQTAPGSFGRTYGMA